MTKRRPERRKEVLSVRMSTNDYNALQEFAWEQEVSVGQIVRKAIKLYMQGLLDDYDADPDRFDD